jgi:hypothetical protein
MSQKLVNETYQFKLFKKPSMIANATRWSMQVVTPGGTIVFAIDSEIGDAELAMAKDPEYLLACKMEHMGSELGIQIARKLMKNVMAMSPGSNSMPTPPQTHSPAMVPQTDRAKVEAAYPKGSAVKVFISGGWKDAIVMGHESRLMLVLLDSSQQYDVTYKDALTDVRLPNGTPILSPFLSSQFSPPKPHGPAREAEANDLTACPECGGTGTIQLFTTSVPCEACGGSGHK